ncbi:hypothetical protein [Chondromyces apiculatus]|nr:hypothetical protein [Chondromyces apiculatus]
MGRDSMFRVWMGAVLSMVVGCGGAASTTGAKAPTGSDASAADSDRPPVKSGSDKEHPALRCGPRDSYAFVASYTCADGSVPLAGDVEAGREARTGNVGENAMGHVIDHYRVPCPEGDVALFVDMYGCPEMAAKLAAPDPVEKKGEHLSQQELMQVAGRIHAVRNQPFEDWALASLDPLMVWLDTSPDVKIVLCKPMLAMFIDEQMDDALGKVMLAHAMLTMAQHTIMGVKGNEMLRQLLGLDAALHVYEQWRTVANGKPVPKVERLRALRKAKRLGDAFPPGFTCTP